MKRIIFLICIILLSNGVFAQELPKEGHPKLESILYQLAQTPNDLIYNFSTEHGLYVVNNSVRVYVQLQNTTYDQYNLPADFGTKEKGGGNVLRALIRTDKLLDLANDPNIQYIRTPDVGFPLENEQRQQIVYLSTVIVIILFIMHYFLKRRSKNR